MSFLEKYNLLRRLDALIERKGTGAPKELARRLNISKATLFRQLDELRNLGSEIKYCKYRKTYYYEKKVSLKIF